MKTFKELKEDPFGNDRRAKRKARLRAKGELARKHGGKVTISGMKKDPGFGIAPKDKPKYTPKAPKVNLKKSDGVTITRPKNLGSDW